jgi:hypothetical protein
MVGYKEADDAKKSRSERECPDETETICEEIWELLAEWEPEYEYDTEDEYTQELGEYLDANSQWEVEIMPNVAGMKPDILIGDALAIELKLSPNKAEMDRCIGQCANYSREWVTWMFLINTSASKMGWLEKLLCDKGLEHIAVWGR